MNQILRLPVLKYTHREKKNKLKIKQKQKTKQKKPPKNKTAPSSLPKKKKEDSHNILDGAPYGNSQGIEPSTAVARTPTPEAVGILDFLHFYISAT